jgi:hypothetical protein
MEIETDLETTVRRAFAPAARPGRLELGPAPQPAHAMVEAVLDLLPEGV